MIEELVKQFETELMTQETNIQETTQETETTETTQETDESQKPVSIVQTIVEQLEREMTTTDDVSDDEDKPTESEQADESDDDLGDERADEPKEDDQLTELMDELQAKSKALDKERTELLERVEQAEQRAEQYERQMKRLVLSHALANRDDLTDKRLIAELVDVESMDVGKDGMTIEEAVTEKINEVVKKYGNVLAKTTGEKYVARNIGGMTTYEKVKPIGRATSRADSPPIDTKSEMLKEMKERAESTGNPADRIRYLAKAREWGLL